MKLTLGQAAKETGLSKSTLSKAIRSGRISAERHDDGSLSIDASELFRVYTRKPLTETGERTVGHPQETPPDTPSLDAEMESLRARLAERDATIADLRGERDRLLTVMEEQARSMRLLTDQRSPAALSHQRFWRRLWAK